MSDYAYMTAEDCPEWFVERVAYDLKDGETIEQAVAKERSDYEEMLEEYAEEEDRCTQSWPDVVKVMRQLAGEIRDNAQAWCDALDAEEKRTA